MQEPVQRPPEDKESRDTLQDRQTGVLEKIHAWACQLRSDGVTLWFACKHPDTPLLVKFLCVLVVAYALSPIDLIPDFIPVLGYLDEVILLPCLIWLAIKLIPTHVLGESRIKANQWIDHEGQQPRSTLGAIGIVIIWLSAGLAGWVYLISPHL